MDILVLGGGGREHALAWAIRRNPKCGRLFVAPGNAGTAALARNVALDPADGAAVVAFARAEGIGFVVVGPEAPLVAGVADALAAAGIAVLGPSAAAARLEASKTFTKEVCAATGAPTAAWAAFDDEAAALAHLRRRGAPVVVKADGLAAGKGVTVAATVAAAAAAVTAAFAGAFGAAGRRVLLEDVLAGEEASLFVLCDGTTALALGSAVDYKRAFDGDAGPNTGGMGAHSPAPALTAAVEARAMATIVRPVVAEMARRGTPFRGILYAGLMVAAGIPRLVEFNVRFGDPEAQVLMMRLGGQALDLMLACAEGRLAAARVDWADDHALTVVMATRGYPGPHGTGSVIGGLDRLPGDSRRMLFHAATERRGGEVVAAGGRVLAATGRGATLAEARARAYGLAAAVDWPEGFYRHDIGDGAPGRPR
ncbi:MAG: phosphoribosylamine--glycine ligase [Rhodobacteraceae bacterium]|nr:phosphoribosylamine--glycine ligase [Paracoccaceae bacterium]